MDFPPFLDDPTPSTPIVERNKGVGQFSDGCRIHEQHAPGMFYGQRDGYLTFDHSVPNYFVHAMAAVKCEGGGMFYEPWINMYRRDGSDMNNGNFCLTVFNRVGFDLEALLNGMKSQLLNCNEVIF
ncbi:hypothetical protein CDAR_460261 [Caerostris darwini]|uniref:Uncharacterized protein n=1 Tax=Caerostris darwini TaxID=1538125 RepID=A0AAV4RA49_9ARAC|nr:hypothetical protein CDAR_460261 [Caerostris darwini]